MAFLAFGMVFLLSGLGITAAAVDAGSDCTDECHGGVLFALPIGFCALVGLWLIVAGLMRITQERSQRGAERRERELRAMHRQFPGTD